MPNTKLLKMLHDPKALLQLKTDLFFFFFWNTYFSKSKQNVCTGLSEQLNLHFNYQEHFSEQREKLSERNFYFISKDIWIVQDPEIIWKELLRKKYLCSL